MLLLIMRGRDLTSDANNDYVKKYLHGDKIFYKIRSLKYQ